MNINLIGEAIIIANYITNCPPLTRFGNKTPEEVFIGKKPDLSRIHPFCSTCFAKINILARLKLSEVVKERILIVIQENCSIFEIRTLVGKIFFLYEFIDDHLQH